MSKRIRSLVIVSVTIVALTAVLAALLLFVPEDDGSSSDPSEESTVDLSVKIIEKDTDASGNVIEKPVKKADFTAETESFSVSPDSSGNMRVEKYTDLPINEYAINSVVESLSNMTATMKVADNSDNQSDFGLDKPQSVIGVTYHDDSELTLQIGNKTPSENGHYVRIGEGGPIYIVSSGITESLLQESPAYIGTVMMTAPSGDSDKEEATAVMYSVTLGGTSRPKPMTMRIRKQNDDQDLKNYSYIMTAPYLTGTSFKETSISSTMAAYTSLSASNAVAGHPTKEQLSEYGLDKPFSTAEICLAIQTPIESEDETDDVEYEYGGYLYYTISLGNKDESGYYYATINKIDAVYLVSPSSLPWAETQWNDVASDMLFLIDITTVTEMSVDISGTTTRFELNHYPDEEERDDMLKVVADGKTYPTDDFRSLYSLMMGSMRYGPMEKEPSGTPEITVTIKRTDSALKSRTIKFYYLDASLYTCVAEGGESYTIKKSDVSYLKTQYQNYLDGKAIVSR